MGPTSVQTRIPDMQNEQVMESLVASIQQFLASSQAILLGFTIDDPHPIPCVIDDLNPLLVRLAVRII